MKRYLIISIVVLSVLAALSSQAMAVCAVNVQTAKTGTIAGTVYTDGCTPDTDYFTYYFEEIPAGADIKWARIYHHIWMEGDWTKIYFTNKNEQTTLRTIDLTTTGCNQNETEGFYGGGCGTCWVYWNVTPIITDGINYVTIDNRAPGVGDGRSMQCYLVVAYEMSGFPSTKYFVNQGYVDITSGQSHTTQFSGTLVDSNRNGTLWHLGLAHNAQVDIYFSDNYIKSTNGGGGCGYGILEQDEIDSSFINPSSNSMKWDDISDEYLHPALAIFMDSTVPEIDLIVEDIEFPVMMRPGTNYIIDAKVKNQGGVGTGVSFKVRLEIDGQHHSTISGVGPLNGGQSTTVSFTNVNPGDGCHIFKVIADYDNDVDESIEDNNEREEDYQVGYVIVVESNADFAGLDLPTGCYEYTGGTHYIQDLTGAYSIQNCAGKGITIKGTTEPFVIRDCTIKDCSQSGVWLHDLDHGTVKNCIIHDNDNYGIEVGLVPLDDNDPEYINIHCNDLYQNYYGIELIGYQSTVKSNVIRNNDGFGLYLYGDNNEIYNNSIKDNDNYGIKAYDSSNNYIYRNDFIDNNGGGVQGYDDGTTNTWNSASTASYPYDCTLYTNYIGNHWSDHTGSHTNGIVNTPYSLEGGTAVVDNYPQVVLWRKCGDVNREGTVNVIGDVQLLFNKVVYGCSSCPGINLWASDVNCQDGVNVFDTSRLFLNQIYGDPLCCCLPDCKICCCE